MLFYTILLFVITFISPAVPKCDSGRTSTCTSHWKITPITNPKKIIVGFGYPAEEHTVLTEDGYILTLHRIPRDTRATNKESSPVLLIHGIMLSSADFVNVSPNQSLGYILWDMGYDVWMGNARGNSYSKKHVSVDASKDPRTFYNFSWHEIGVFDIPAMIDYILNATNEQNLYYIGHSQGCTTFYVTMSTRPEYNEKIRIASLMAPAGFVTNVPEYYVHILSRVVGDFQALLEDFHIYHVPLLNTIRSYIQHLCENDANFDFCKALYYLFGCGYSDDSQITKDLFKKIFRTTPSDASLKQFVHYFQEVKTGKFCQFDYGERQNIRIYGSRHPPEYNISRITAPVALYYGRNDRLVSIKDVKNFAKRLPNVVKDYLIPYKKFNHGDFVFASNAKNLLYNEMLNVMDRFRK